jgi:hypothetical protein
MTNEIFLGRVIFEILRYNISKGVSNPTYDILRSIMGYSDVSKVQVDNMVILAHVIKQYFQGLFHMYYMRHS